VSPLIQELASLSPDTAAEYHWFDMTAAYKKEQVVDHAVLDCPLPFPNAALVCAFEDKKVMILLHRTGISTAVCAWLLEKKSYKQTIPFVYVATPEGVKVRHDGDTEIIDGSKVTPLAFVSSFLNYLKFSPVIGHQPIKRSNWAKKIRQGKPLVYDWTTIVIEPPKQKNEPLGGVHASPRWHERRGHWRNVKKTGKHIWVRDCEVGNKALGAVFHDYKVQ